MEEKNSNLDKNSVQELLREVLRYLSSCIEDQVYYYEERGVEVRLGNLEKKKIVDSIIWCRHSTSGVYFYSSGFL